MEILQGQQIMNKVVKKFLKNILMVLYDNLQY